MPATTSPGRDLRWRAIDLHALKDSIGRWLFYVTVGWGACLMWLAPRLPMSDLPQHAAQVSLLRDLAFGVSPWEPLVHVNLFTPYLVEYGVALLLSLALPVNVAFSLLLSLAFLGFVAACLGLRRDLGGDARLDWLFIPGFFGFAWKFGFVTFLVAAPVGIVFVILARRHAQRPSPRGGLWLGLTGLLLFFSHGLVFLFAVFVGALFLLLRYRSRNALPSDTLTSDTPPSPLPPTPSRLVWLAPYAALALLALVYQRVGVHADATPNLPSGAVWDAGFGAGALYDRLKTFLLFPFGFRGDRLFAPGALLAAAAPWALGARPNRLKWGWWVPFSALVLVYFTSPSAALKADYLYERFAVFTLPFYALLFTRPAPRPSDPPARRALVTLTTVALALGCWVYLGAQTAMVRAFARESAGANRLLALIPNGQRVLSLTPDSGSTAAHNPAAYIHYTSWYQATSRGFVDLNFAYYLPQIVRFRGDRRPAVVPGFESHPLSFDFRRHEGHVYDYFVVRGDQPETTALVQRLLDNGECRVEPVRSEGEWLLLARRECRSR